MVDPVYILRNVQRKIKYQDLGYLVFFGMFIESEFMLKENNMLDFAAKIIAMEEYL